MWYLFGCTGFKLVGVSATLRADSGLEWFSSTFWVHRVSAGFWNLRFWTSFDSRFSSAKFWCPKSQAVSSTTLSSTVPIFQVPVSCIALFGTDFGSWSSHLDLAFSTKSILIINSSVLVVPIPRKILKIFRTICTFNGDPLVKRYVFMCLCICV